MISTFTVFVDANVLFGKHIRSLLAFMAQTKMFRARWSHKVHEEWTRSVSAKLGIDVTKLDNQVRLLNTAIPDAMVRNFEALEQGLELPDMNDVHVLAAAIRTRADTILTFNLKDFPADYIEKYGLETQHPDDFFMDQFGISSELFIEALAEDYQHYKPIIPFNEYVNAMRNAGLPKTAKLIDSLKVVIVNE